MANPITITFYNEQDEVITTHQRATVVYGLLKKAVMLEHRLDGLSPEGQIDLISDYVVEVFGGRFTRQELEQYADIGDVFGVFYEIINRAGALVKSLNFTRGKTGKK